MDVLGYFNILFEINSEIENLKISIFKFFSSKLAKSLLLGENRC